jgi:hypothetical protein
VEGERLRESLELLTRPKLKLSSSSRGRSSHGRRTATAFPDRRGATGDASDKSADSANGFHLSLLSSLLVISDASIFFVSNIIITPD